MSRSSPVTSRRLRRRSATRSASIASTRSRSPEQKLDVVRALQARPELRSIVMVGDGINDAPALALADVGVAMGSAGATVSSETADAVVLVDRVDRVADAISFSRRALYIARQSVLLGIGASLVAMGFAAARLPASRRRRAPSGRNRRRGDRQRAAGASRLISVRLNVA